MNSSRQKLRYVLDARPAMTHSTGVGNYVCGLAKGFAQLVGSQQDASAVAEELVLFTSSWSEKPGPELRAIAQASSINLKHVRLPVRGLNFSWHHLGHPKVERFVGAVDVAHSPHPLILPAAKACEVVTVHDLYFLEQKEHTFKEVRRDYGNLLWPSLRKARAVLVVSKATRRDLLVKAEASGFSKDSLRLLDDKTHVTANGVDFDFFGQLDRAPAQSNEIPSTDFLLAVGRIEPRKNPERILEALGSEPLRNKRLLWAGMPADAETETWFQQCLQHHQIEDRVEVLGYVDRDRLRTLYSQAEALVFPSLNEGFGLPILEAMAAGCPVVTANTTAMPEVAGDAAILVDPLSVSAIVKGILELDHRQHRHRLIERGKLRARSFSWTNTARATLEVYRSLSGGNNFAQRSSRSSGVKDAAR